MRRDRKLLLTLLLAATPVVAQAPTLQALDGFQPGRWQAKALGTDAGENLCLMSPEPMLTARHQGQGCSFNSISDGASGAVVTWRCRTGQSGRTALRRDTADIYVVDAQGLDSNLPFSSRTEWRRQGSC